MKSLIITCFESNESRVSLVKETFDILGYECEVITTDFSHSKKEKRTIIPDGYKTIETKEYKKNLSFERLYSHYCFAKDAFKKAERIKPDIIWVLAPANSLVKEANAYKKKYPETKVIIDIIDMWPESLPVKINKNIFPLSIWKNARSKYLNCADALISECDKYQAILNDEYNGSIKTVYWCKESSVKETYSVEDNEKFHLLYLGSINNIIDIEAIKEMILSCDSETVLHIIGDGEKRDLMLETLKEVCEVEYYGIIRDEKMKSEIMSKCHAGINMYKKNLYIGLTMKCIDYFDNGLPIINNIPDDTWNLVEKFIVGINYKDDGLIDCNKLIDLRKEHKRIKEFYNTHFSKEVFIENCRQIIKEVNE